MTDSTGFPPPPPPPPRGSGMRLLVGLTLVALVLFATSLGLIWWLATRVDTGRVGKGTFLEVVLEGELYDATPQPGFLENPDDLPLTVAELAASIRRAADDDRISGLYLQLDSAQGGWASWQDLRAAVEAFRASGKPCVAYSPGMLTNGSYYLATSCGQIWMAPAGITLINGLALELTYYKGLFDKLGINPEFEHVGDFKSFVEAYERTGPSAPATEAYQGLLDSLFDQLVSGIAAGRGKTVEEVRALVDAATLTPRIAVERGLLDGLAWPDAMRVRAHKAGTEGWADLLDDPVTDEEKPELTSVREYVKETRRSSRRRGATILVVHAEGSIVTGEDEPGLFGDSGMLTDREYERWMRRAREDDSVKAVVVRVNSPGGSALAASLMWRENARTKALGKPVVVSMGDYAASGGYLMSANADWIVAAPGTLTGSIGVFGGKFDLSGTYDKLGLATHTFQRGERAEMLSFTHAFDPDERAVFREYMEDFYDQFLDIVAEGRSMTREEVHRVAQGRVWTGEQALAHRLVDQLGTLDDAVAKAAELAGIEDPVVRHLPERKGFLDLLLQDLDRSVLAPQARLPIDIDPAGLRELAVLERIARDGGLGAYVPGSPRVR